MKALLSLKRPLPLAAGLMALILAGLFFLSSREPADSIAVAESSVSLERGKEQTRSAEETASPTNAAVRTDPTWHAGKPPPEPVYREDDPHRILSAVEHMVRDAETIERRPLEPDEQGRPGWLRLVHVPAFKYPWLRVKERFQVGADGSIDPFPTVEVAVADHILARFPESMELAEQEARVAAAGGELLRRSLLPGLVVVSLEGVSLDGVPEMIDRLAESGAVAYAEPDWIVGHLGGRIPNDPDFSRLWSMPVVSAPQAWEVTTGSRDIVVAVIDTGVDYRHEDLTANMWQNPGETADNSDTDGNGFIDDIRGWNFNAGNNDPFDDNGHGTHVAGIIGAVGNNSIGITGAAWTVSIMPLKTFSAGGTGSTSDNVDAVQYAVLNGAHVINASWGGGAFSQALYDAIADARDARVAFIAAAGNSNGRIPVFPARYGHLEEDPLLNVLSVGATHFVPGPDGPEERKAPFSEWGAHIGAPGVSIHSTIPGGSYAALSGTSMAAPLVAGAASLMLTVNPETNAEDLVFWLRESADTVPTLAATVINAARLNMAAAVFANTSDPIMAYHGFTFVDLDGPRAGNGIVNPGETIELTLNVGVRGPNPAVGTTARLSTEDPDVTLLTDTVTLGDFEPWERRDTPSPFIFTVAADAATPRTLTFNLDFEDAEGRSWEATVDVPLFTSFDISGIVRATDGTPLANATITVGGDREFTTTSDANGRYTVELTEGSYSIAAEAEGMLTPVVRRFEIPLATAEVDFVLGSGVLEALTTEVAGTLRPGERKRIEIILTNTGTAPLDYSVRPMDYAFESFLNGLNNPNHPEFAWLEITEDGTFLDYLETWFPQEMLWADGSGTGTYNEATYFMMPPISIGFPFPFYDERFQTLRVNNSGWLSFTGYNRSGSAHSGQPGFLPNPARAENKIAFAWNHPSNRGGMRPPAWTSWGDETAAQTLHYAQVDEHTFVINWNRWPSWILPLTFREYLSGQVVLKSDGTILIKYKSYEAQPGHNIGGRLPRTYAVGLQDGTNTRGMTVVYGEEKEIIRPGTVFRFRPQFGAPWLETQPGVGRISGFGGERVLELTLDAAHLPEGEYHTTLVIDNNGTGGPIEIPVHLTVDPQAPPAPDMGPEEAEPFSVRIEGQEFGGEPTVISVNRAVVDRTDVPVVDLAAAEFSTWGPADRDHTRQIVFAEGSSVRISREGFTSYPFSYNITENTVIEFDYRNAYDTFAVGRGTVHGIGLADGSEVAPERIFQLLGDRTDWGSILDHRVYPINITGSGRSSAWQRFRIPVGRHYTGSIDRIVFVQHARAARGLEVLDPDNTYRNIRIFEVADGDDLEFQWTFEDSPETAVGDALTRAFTEPGEKILRVEANEGHRTASATRVVSVAGEPRLRLRINFQPEGILVPGGFLPDEGATFGDRGHGFHYGWNVNSRAQMRRDAWFSSSINAQSDTLAFFGTTRYWEIAVPDGLYRVTVQSGSGAFSGSHLIFAEDELLLNASTHRVDDPYASASRIVPVSDGRLTLTSGRNTTTINFVVIERVGDLNLIPPIADFTLSPQSGEAPLTVQFDSSASFDGDGTLVRRDWSFGDGFTALGTAPQHTFHLPGRYEVALTVTDNDGLQNTVSRTVIVGGAASPHVVITPPPPGAELSATSGPLTYSIHLSDPPAAGVTVNLSAAANRLALSPASLHFTPADYAQAQSVTVAAPASPAWPFGTFGESVAHTVSSTDPAYHGSPIPDVVVTVRGPEAPFAPVITAQPDSASVFLGSTVTFAAAANANPPPQWAWYHEGQPIAGANGPTLTLTNLTAANAGSYRARAFNAEGEAFTQAASLSVREAPTARTLAVSFDGYTGEETLEHFPVLLRLHEGLPGFGYNTFADPEGGSDLRFFADDLSTVLPHEIEVWNPLGTSTVWVRVPQIEAGGTTIVATWGEASGASPDSREVWANDFRLVYHFGESDGSLRNSGPHGFDGQVVDPVGSIPAAGITGFAYDFAGDFIDAGVNAADLGIDGSGPRTVSFWINHRGLDAGAAFALGQPSGNGLWSLRPRGKNQLMNDLWRMDFHGAQQDFTFTTADTWVHFAIVYDGGEARAYANGQIVEASRRTTTLDTSSTGNLLIGAFDESFLDGLMDAFRVASVARSSDWIRAEHATTAPDESFARYEVLANGPEWPVIVRQPHSQRVATGSTVVFEVSAASTLGTPFSFEWFHEETLLASTGAVLELPNVTAANDGAYRVRVTNSRGETWSREATLAVLDIPEIFYPPQSQTVGVGTTATFSVTASGSEPFRYQWYRDDEPIPGAVAREHTVHARLFDDAVYRVRVTNEVGSVLSEGADLHIVSAPVIRSEPRNASVVRGLPYSFAVEVDAVPAPTFQWYRNGQALSGETGPVLHLPAVHPEMAGEYAVVVRNSLGTVTSGTAVLTTRELPERPALRIAFPGYDGSTTLTNFPVLIRLNQQIPGFRYIQFADRTHGSDLRFYDASMEGELPYEIDYWNELGQTAVWVRLPELSPNGTEIIATWGDPANVRPLDERDFTDVWEENAYSVVYHMSGSGTTVPDSTAFDRNGIVRNPAGERWVSGIVGRAYDFTTDYMDIPNARVLQIDGSRSRTVSFWAYTRRFNNAGMFHFGIFADRAMWSLRTGDTDNRWLLELEWGPSNREFSFEGKDRWVHFSAVYDGQEARVYANGRLIPESVVRVGLVTSVFNGRIGSYQVQPQFNFDGRIDEFRVATLARHPDWIRAEWATVGEHAEFTRYNPLQRHDASPPVIVGHPAETWARPGDPVALTVVATTPPEAPVSYQWFFNDQPIAGATGATLQIPQASFTHVGSYHVVVTNSHGSTETNPAWLLMETTATRGEWAGMPLDAFGWADTGGFLGAVFVPGSWVYTERMQRWIFLPEENVTTEGAWMFLLPSK